MPNLPLNRPRTPSLCIWALNEAIATAALSFSNNPREIKRFKNVFRFQYYILLMREKPPTFEQVNRWITLLMKWPEVIRWLQWSETSIEQSTKHELVRRQDISLAAYRLRRLEDISVGSKNLQEWQRTIENEFQIKADTLTWINDETLFNFFRYESTLNDRERLSAIEVL
jgi:hypothetical protein